jgi:hypothetical protein
LITTDQNLEHQQNLGNRRIAVLVLPTPSRPVVRAHLDEVPAALARVRPGAIVRLAW